ncbi:RNA polymerase sigma24 factor [Catellatospora sp. IY07-71]|uniref:SigE family RNA polymerase sigma factor n=1 Tax=Catellatospora sp. IY07-71 TaxID=2728827 RepID=UPI001BB32AAD|nr:SigE family RNA polymerase sigma factor [Catellatospora sp. IY07-71]BCJ70968.1 RNA polymerase sigma24 factor [Catellatospora sp. IY07-71]
MRTHRITEQDEASPPTHDIDEFYAVHFQQLTVQLYAYTGDLGLAQEFVQEAFCRAIPRWSKLAAYDDPLAWIRRVAFNLANSRWRRVRSALAFARTQREEHMPGPGPDRVVLARALSKLPASHRRVVVLHHLADVPVAEIARIENVAEGTVRVWLHRGRAALATELADLRKDHRHV